MSLMYAHNLPYALTSGMHIPAVLLTTCWMGHTLVCLSSSGGDHMDAIVIGLFGKERSKAISSSSSQTEDETSNHQTSTNTPRQNKQSQNIGKCHSQYHKIGEIKNISKFDHRTKQPHRAKNKILYGKLALGPRRNVAQRSSIIAPRNHCGECKRRTPQPTTTSGNQEERIQMREMSIPHQQIWMIVYTSNHNHQTCHGTDDDGINKGLEKCNNTPLVPVHWSPRQNARWMQNRHPLHWKKLHDGILGSSADQSSIGGFCSKA